MSTRVGVAYLAALVAMVALDALWLGVIAGDVYRDALGPLMADPINLPAAAAFPPLLPQVDRRSAATAPRPLLSKAVTGPPVRV